ncbi:MAG: hypothetical protein V8S92_03030 [Oscillospiraceae bacterium]
MKKSVKILLLVLAVLLALTGVGLFAVTQLDARAKQEHAALSGAVEARDELDFRNARGADGKRRGNRQLYARRSGAIPNRRRRRQQTDFRRSICCRRRNLRRWALPSGFRGTRALRKTLWIRRSI